MGLRKEVDMRTLTAYKFVPMQESETIANVLKSVFELTEVIVVARDSISFAIVEFDDYDELKPEEVTFLQEHFDGYYIVANGKAIEIYNGLDGKYIKTTTTVLAEMQARYQRRNELARQQQHGEDGE
jgi:hypothetical protein